MPKSLLVFTLLGALSLLSAGARAAQLTETETRWLRAGAPVLDYAREIGLPIDIIVQPQARPGDVPFAMGFDGDRCKLVLSMRGNPQAEAILEQLPAGQRGVMIEAMTAHEVGHCWRYAQGSWHVLPAGFVEVGQEYAADPHLLEESKEMRETRREEGFSDLVALAWTRGHHPAEYAEVYAWLEKVRRDQPLAGSSHDTLVWLRAAGDGAAFQPAASPFDQAMPLWSKGLSEGRK
ncbi:MAG TPA: hypothetical protein VGP06_20255 [Janthinobacterium sp.]|jgi:hypothetical protein|nr:hypothetical protein [Janthinobacterium sp.]